MKLQCSEFVCAKEKVIATRLLHVSEVLCLELHNHTALMTSRGTIEPVGE